MSPRDALAVAKQVAEALEAAHERDIVHRDLKPANIKVRDDGVVKVLDFGLAKALAGGPDDPARQSDLANSPTLTAAHAPGTQLGMILGTAAYMAPEQAKGRAVDKRADVWAFGVVLFEMLAGAPPFEGDDVAEVLAAVVRADPNWTALPPDVPPQVRRLLQRCLTKDLKQRLHHIADARFEIDEAMAAETSSGATPTAPARRRLDWRAAALAAVALGVGVAAGAWWWRTPTAASAPMHAEIPVTPAEAVESSGAGGLTAAALVLPAGGARTAMAWSPDGQSLAFIGIARGVAQIYVRDLGAETARVLESSAGARTLAFSPDGEWIAFHAAGEIRKVNVAGGPFARICAASVANGLSWGDKLIVIGSSTLMAVPPSGGEAQPLLPAEPTLVRRSQPHLLPGDSAVVFTEHEGRWTSGKERVKLLALTADGKADGAPAILIQNGADARYLPTGHMVFMKQGALFAVPFDRPARRVTGAEVPIRSGIVQTVAAGVIENLTLAGQFDVSSHGTLAYIGGALPSYPISELVAVDRRGAVSLLGAGPRPYSTVSLSVDGQVVAVAVRSTTDIRLFQVDRLRASASLARADLRGEVTTGVWAPDGRLASLHSEDGVAQLVVIPRDGGPILRVPDAGYFWPTSWSKQGHLAGVRGGDIAIYSPEATGEKVTVFHPSSDVETHPMFSPDGNWLAYVSNESRTSEVYVRPYPGPGPRVKVSAGRASNPAWHPSGKELFYIEGPEDRLDRRMMSVPMSDPRRPGAPVELFAFTRDELALEGSPMTGYGVSPDGRFIGRKMAPWSPVRVTHLKLIVNWFEELRAKLGTAR
jgi:serine/threonine-protein kinase